MKPGSKKWKNFMAKLYGIRGRRGDARRALQDPKRWLQPAFLIAGSSDRRR